MKYIFKLFLSLLLLISIIVTIQAFDISTQKKMNAAKSEMMIDGVQLKLMGSSSDLMLEGEVSDEKTSKFAEQIALQYFSNVFNIITVKKISFNHKCHIAEIKKIQNSPTNSKYVDVLHQGFESKTPWNFLLFDQKEVENFSNEIKENLSAEFKDVLEIQSTQTETNIHQITFFDSIGNRYNATLQSSSLDNGFYSCLITITTTQDGMTKTLFENTLFCRKGEWFVITGFTSILKKSNLLNDTDNIDIIFIFNTDSAKDNI